MVNNIFGLIEPSEYICSIIYYARGHSVIGIEVKNPVTDDLKYGIFYDVDYYSGPTVWKGADFHIEEFDECLNLIKQLGRYENIPLSILKNDLRIKLYTVRVNELVGVRILAREAEFSPTPS